MRLALNKSLQVIPEGNPLILKDNFTGISFDRKMSNTGGGGLILTKNININPRNAPHLGYKKKNHEDRTSVDQ